MTVQELNDHFCDSDSDVYVADDKHRRARKRISAMHRQWDPAKTFADADEFFGLLMDAAFEAKGSASEPDELGTEPDAEPDEPDADAFYCELCEARFNGPGQLRDHFQGKRHRRREAEVEGRSLHAHTCERPPLGVPPAPGT